MKSLSAVYHVLNEAEFIHVSISQVQPFVDEVIVMDHGSTDGTQDIVLGMGIPIHDTGGETFLTKGEPWFRTWSVRECKTDWLLTLDGDEIMSDGWREALNKKYEEVGDAVGAFKCAFHIFVGSFDYVQDISPLTHESIWAKVLRKHSKLRGGKSWNNTKCHSNYDRHIKPKVFGWVEDMAIFHCGYMKADAAGRMARNFTRGDVGTDEVMIARMLALADQDPWQFFPQVKPAPAVSIPAALWPWAGRYTIELDGDKIKSRRKLW